jgi:hypothetical protein
MNREMKKGTEIRVEYQEQNYRPWRFSRLSINLNFWYN